MASLDQDDLDDLDDVLEQFSRQPEPQSATSDGPSPTSPLSSPPPPPPTATATTFTAGRPRTNTRVDARPVPMPGNGPGLPGVSENEEDISADFAAELARGMENLMREIASGESSSADAGTVPNEEELKAAWEAMLIEGMNGLSGEDAAEDQGSVDTNAFQAKIKQAMGKLKEGEDAIKSSDGSSSASAAPSDPFAALLASLAGNEDGDLPQSEAELAGLLENMMGELMSKEILYDPLKELAEKFPPYLASPPAPISTEERKRYEDQLQRVQAILALFDKPTYSDEDPEARESVVALMAEMQSFGSPPAELMGPVPPGFDSLGPDGCVVC
ncbi:Pex19 protein family-domain-containing protein [Mycena amicta]|nr:Pex19 protein family-domain-containing protein [Mycena amicta]